MLDCCCYEIFPLFFFYLEILVCVCVLRAIHLGFEIRVSL